jgi:hypothetical protein
VLIAYRSDNYVLSYQELCPSKLINILYIQSLTSNGLYDLLRARGFVKKIEKDKIKRKEERWEEDKGVFI